MQSAGNLFKEWNRRAHQVFFFLMKDFSPWMLKLVHDSENVPVIARAKFPANIHEIGVVSSEEDAIPPHFFFRKKINRE